jgi:2,3,4,5-tetrahydropyridine-2,6-dicarboxylate N-succinyltransferase
MYLRLAVFSRPRIGGKMTKELQKTIDNAWDDRQGLNVNTPGVIRKAVEETLALLDSGKLRAAEKKGKTWAVNQWAKKAVLLSFRLNPMELLAHGAYPARDFDKFENHSFWYDKVPSKFIGWDEKRFQKAGFRAAPGAIVRHSAFIGKDVVLMPSFVNVGAYVGEGTMVDTWVTIGSCAQIGKHCHISGGVGIGGVLEPLQAEPVIIEDNCFIGARSEVAEGVVVEEGSVLSMGVYLGASTKIVDRATGNISYGRVPAYSVVVPGTLPGKTPASPGLYCAVIVKRVDEKTRSKTGINDILRGV